MKDVYYRPDEVDQPICFLSGQHQSWAHKDLLFQVLVDWGVDLSLPIRP